VATIPTTEPVSFRAGDLLTWEKDLSLYPANDGWSLAYTLINSAQKLSIASSASGAKHLVSVSAATTAAYVAGLYQWAARVTKTTEIYTIKSGTIEILPNIAAAGVLTYDFRSHAKTMLDALEAAFEGRATSTQLEYQISGRQIRSMTPEDMITWRNYFKTEVVREQQAEQFARTGINPRRIGVRLVRV